MFNHSHENIGHANITNNLMILVYVLENEEKLYGHVLDCPTFYQEQQEKGESLPKRSPKLCLPKRLSPPELHRIVNLT